MARFPLHWIGGFCAELIFTILSNLDSNHREKVNTYSEPMTRLK